ncbi:MAG: ABC transporter ATP-binding protein/permease [Clostridiales bacterium]|nr:ABC transporter ATP-binding protein/permease [Clostridiales bacterium]
MLQLKHIKKDYKVTNELTVHALKGVSLNFRKNEFVSILGPSGCGKTTMLNIIGGLDRYSDGDLVINGKSTKGFNDSDWDAYRNRSIGFVFQSYNLIPHMNVLDNVTLALSIAGEAKEERIKKARLALEKVGLGDQLKKRPNQLSGGQMQRVAIARAIVNDPDIILADEPTGALDSETGVQVMELLKEIAQDRLVIMVTHNGELAEKYSTRIVNLFDGELVGDSNAYSEKECEQDLAAQQTVVEAATENASQADSASQAKSVKRPKRQRRGMSLWTAFVISARSLNAKKGRTFWTSFAGSIGIFGITIVLAISAGMDRFVLNMQSEAVGDTAITITETAYDVNKIYDVIGDVTGGKPYPKDTTGVVPYNGNMFSSMVVNNNLSEQYIQYINNMNVGWVNAVNFTYSVKMNVLQLNANTGKYVRRNRWSTYARQMISNAELVEDNYSVLYKLGDDGEPTDYVGNGYPKDYTEVSIVVDRYNRLSTSALENLGLMEKKNDELPKEIPYSEIVGKEYKLILNDGWYTRGSNGWFTSSDNANATKYANLADSDYAVTLKIVSVLRPKNDKATMWLQSGLAYLPELTDFVLSDSLQSQVSLAQLENTDKDVFSGYSFPDLSNYGMTTKEQLYIEALKNIGAYASPTAIAIYPKNASSKMQIANYLNRWNELNPDNVVVYTDYTQVAVNVLNTVIDVISYVLIAFSAISLVVSTVMISIITYTSVVERTKEIGVLRSIGARKVDIASIFNSETVIIGSMAGLLGVGFSIIIGIIVNIVINALMGVYGIVLFSAEIILGMLLLSIGLTLLAGLVPAIVASRKDPVTCLRTD